MTAEQTEAAALEGMHTQAAPVVALDDEDYTYEAVGQERLLLQRRIAELEAQLATAWRNLEDAQADAAAEAERARRAEAQLAEVGAYGADQWRRGHRGKDPQEFEEWQALER